MLTCGEDAHQKLRCCLQEVDAPRVGPDKEAGQPLNTLLKPWEQLKAAHRWRDDDRHAVARNKCQTLAAAGSVGDER